MKRKRGSCSGSLLIITLWMMTILSVLAIAIGRYLSTEVRIAKYRLAREQAKALARSGVYLAIHRLEEDTKPEADGKTYDWLGDDWAQFEQADAGAGSTVWIVPLLGEGTDHVQQTGQIEVEIIDAERTVDVNSASSLSTPLGTLIGSADVAAAIIDYYDTDSAGDWESHVEAPPYDPKNSRVVALEELLDVPGMQQAIYDKLQHFASAIPTATPIQQVNINTAGRDVLAAIGLPTLADPIISFREQGHYFTSLTPNVETDNPAVPAPFDSSNTEFQNARNRLGVISQVFRVIAKGVLTSPPVQYRVEAVIQRAENGSQILAWREG